ncbi:MAG: ATP-binding protein [Muribaculaceae bacterium]|nr:ATP-binding protein [Muribaculaceae bacterium]
MNSKDYILSLIAEGEHEHQDFKFQITDARKIARSISAFANHSGGHLLIGVKDNGHVAGVRSDEEMYMVEQAAQLYCQPAQPVQFTLYRVEGKSVLKADIAEADVKPVKAPDDNGQWKAYYRVADENMLASSVHVKMLSRDSQADEPAVLQYTERERQLLDYLYAHGGITLTGLTRLVHCSRPAAERMAVNLHDMGVLDIRYHNGTCLLVAKE